MAPRTIMDIDQLVEFIKELFFKINPDQYAPQSVFLQDPSRKDVYGKAINTAIMEISTTLPGRSGVKTVYTTYYLNEEPPHGFRLLRHTSPNKSLMTQLVEDEIKLRDKISEVTKKALEEEDVIFQYDRLFSKIFELIINQYENLGGDTVGLLDKSLIRKCKFVRVDQGTLSVGYSPVDKKYIVRYNPKFCIDATIRYFLNPVLDSSGIYRAPAVKRSNVLYPIMFFLSHEFAHVLYRHVTKSEQSIQSDLPHYVIQFFGDAYINNSIPYLLGDESGRNSSGNAQSDIYTAKSHHPIGINDQIPVDNYLKESYVVEIYKSLQSQDLTLIDKAVEEHLRKYVDLLTPPQTKSSITDDLGFSSPDEFAREVNSLPLDIKKKVLRSHVKFFTGNLYDIMSRIFAKGFSSNSYMRILKALMESLFEDLQTTETSTKKAPKEDKKPSQTPSSPPDKGANPPQQQQQIAKKSRYKVGDWVRQVSTGKIGKVIKVNEDGTYVIDTSQTPDSVNLEEGVSPLNESFIHAHEDDLEIYKVETKDPDVDPNTKPNGSENNQDPNRDPTQDPQNPEQMDGSSSKSGDSSSGESGNNQATESPQGGEGQGDQEGDGSRDTTSQGGSGNSGSGTDSGELGDVDPSQVDSTQGNSSSGSSGHTDANTDAVPSDYSGSGAEVPASDFPTLPPEDSENQGQGSRHSGDSSGSGSGGADQDGITPRGDDGFDDLRRALDEAHEESKSGLSDSDNEYLEQDEITRQQADHEIDTEDAKQQVSEILKNVVKEAKEKGVDVDEFLKGLDKEDVNRAYSLDVDRVRVQVSTSTWKRLFYQLISLASGYNLRRDNVLPSRKVEGLWGANKKVPALKDVVILLDCSGSMGSAKFKAIFAELKNLGKFPELKDTWVHLIPWGGSALYKRFKGLNDVTIKQMYAFGKHGSLGSTYPLTGYQMMMHKVRNPDLILMLTDSEYSDYVKGGKPRLPLWYNEENEEEKVRSFLKKVARKTVYVSIDPKSSYMNEYLDPAYKRRLIDLDPSEALKGEDFDD